MNPKLELQNLFITFKLLTGQEKYDKALVILSRIQSLKLKTRTPPNLLAAITENLIGHSQTLISQGKAQLAETLISKATFFAPSNSFTYMLWGYILYLLRKFDQAIEKYQLALKCNSGSNNPKIYNDMGYILQAQGKYEEALENFKEAINVNNKYVWSYLNYSLTLFQLDRVLEANQMFEASIENLKGEGLKSLEEKLDFYQRELSIAEINIGGQMSQDVYKRLFKRIEGLDFIIARIRSQKKILKAEEEKLRNLRRSLGLSWSPSYAIYL